MKITKKFFAVFMAMLIMLVPVAAQASALMAAVPNTYTVTVDFDGRGENVVIENVQEGADIFMR